MTIPCVLRRELGARAVPCFMRGHAVHARTNIPTWWSPCAPAHCLSCCRDTDVPSLGHCNNVLALELPGEDWEALMASDEKPQVLAARFLEALPGQEGPAR